MSASSTCSPITSPPYTFCWGPTNSCPFISTSFKAQAVVQPAHVEMMAPLSTFLISPQNSSQRTNSELTTPVPFVRFVMKDLNPRSPLVGTSKVALQRPSWRSSTPMRTPWRCCIKSMIVEVCWGSISIEHYSIGSTSIPLSFFWVKTSGGDIDISNPSLLIFSIKMPRCRSPLPLIFTLSLAQFSLQSTLKLTSSSASFCSLVNISFIVVLLPSLP